jgi:hypothetical protein
VLAMRLWMVGFRVGNSFVSIGVGVLLENVILRKRRCSLLQRVFVWTFFIFVSLVCILDLIALTNSTSARVGLERTAELLQGTMVG